MLSAARIQRMLKEVGIQPGGEYSFPHLLERLPNVRPGDLAQALEDMQKQGLVQRIVRVESPTAGGGIEDYESVLDVPAEIYDWRAERTIRVKPADLEVVYTIERV